MNEKKGIEVGHIFKLGYKYSKAMNVSVLDECKKPSLPSWAVTASASPEP
jgi:prolyl-tRNA synthetase